MEEEEAQEQNSALEEADNSEDDEKAPSANLSAESGDLQQTVDDLASSSSVRGDIDVDVVTVYASDVSPESSSSTSNGLEQMFIADELQHINDANELDLEEDVGFLDLEGGEDENSGDGHWWDHLAEEDQAVGDEDNGEDLEQDDEGIEIVQVTDEEESESDDDDSDEKTATTFDMSLPNSHMYMGEDMEELHGRTIHSEGEIVLMPLYFQPGVVLAPGQTLPLNLFHPHPIAMMRKVIAADKTFGMIMSKSRRSHDERKLFTNIGVTCQIYSVKEESLYGVDQMSLKCEGRQRFRILSKQFQMDGVILGKILILPDAPLPPYPRSSLIHSNCNQRNALTGQVAANNFFLKNSKWNFSVSRYLAGFNPNHKNVLCHSVAALPGWVYKLYNPYFLMDCLMNEIYSWHSNLNADTIPVHPTDFSHWITANLPLTNEMKIELLEIDSAILRLRRQIELMSKCTTTLACIQCGANITDKGELFSLSQKGPTSAYVNPGGHVHETVTFYKAKNLSLTGRPSTEYSWFPGYAWTVASCKTCHAHMGWKFTTEMKGLHPTKFWGLTRAALKPVFKESVNNGSEENTETPLYSEVMYESDI